MSESNEKKPCWEVRPHSRRKYYYDNTSFFSGCNCSECGKWGNSDFNFCPHCGAKMDGRYKRVKVEQAADEKLHV